MDLKHRSHGITDGRDRAPSRAMFKAIGFTDSDLSKPLIGVANTWIETMPCKPLLSASSLTSPSGLRFDLPRLAGRASPPRAGEWASPW